MPTIRISNFQGTIPAISPKLLEQNQAQTAENCRLKRGIIEPLKDMTLSGITVEGGQVVDSNGDTVVAGKYSLRSATYKWTVSGAQAGEYHVELAGGGDPSLNDPVGVLENGSEITEGTLGSLSASEWGYGDNDSLGYDTVYVRTTDTADPDGKAADYIEAFEYNVISSGQARSFYLMDDSWLHWPSSGVDVVKSFVPDSDYRIYYTGDGVPKQSNYTMSTSGAARTWPTSYYVLGVPAPANVIAVAAVDVELVTNGAFTSDVNNWTATNSATLTNVGSGQSGNCMKVAMDGVPTANGCAVSSVITTEVDKKYSFAIWFKKGDATGGRIYVGTAAENADYLDSGVITDAAWTRYSGTFIATSTTTYITVYADTADGASKYNYYDTISVQEGDGTVTKSIVYVYTYVTTWGEESAPSPASNLLNLEGGQTMQITGFATGISNVTHIRLYRLNLGTAIAEYQLVPYPPNNISAYSASTDYVLDDRVTYEGLTYICLVANGPGSAVKAPTDTDYWSVDVDDCEIADAVANGFDDDREDSELAEIIQTEGWDEPPSDLAGLHLFVNNILVGFSGNELYLFDPNYPYVCPAINALRCLHDIVAVAHYGETLVVLTESQPYQGIGTDPKSMTLKPLPYIRPCLSKRGTVSSERGVIYPSDDGFWIINAAGGTVLTKNLFTKAQWVAKSPSNMICAFWDDKLYTFISGTGTGFYIDMDDMRVIDFSVDDKKFYDANVFGDYLYVLIENQLTNSYIAYNWEQASTELTYIWRSKQFQHFSAFNFNVGRVISDGAVTMKLYVDDVLKRTESITDGSIFRMPSGYRGKVVEMEFTGTSDIDIVAIATSIDELLEG